MFFLFRCVFWLGLVFYHLPWPGGAAPVEEARALAAQLGATSSHALAAQAQAACGAHPTQCLALAASTAGRAAGASRSSLTQDDRQPDWRGGAIRSARADLRSTAVK